MDPIRFFVTGTPKPAGSKRAFINKKTGQPIVTDMSGQKGKDWRHDVKCAAFDAFKEAPLEGPLKLTLVFRLVRPQNHFGTGRNINQLKASAPKYPAGMPDVTKLIRSVEDALSKLLWKDDAQIVTQSACKVYCDEANPHPGVLVIVQPLED